MHKKKIFLIDKDLIKNDFYTTEYFKKAIKILNHSKLTHKTSIMQFKCFSNQEYMIAGINECIEVLKTRLTQQQFKQLEIWYYEDGSIIQPGECVLSIKAKYQNIAMLENILDSILARRSSVATNCYYFLKYLNPNQIIYMADRGDDYHLMPYDGYSAYIAGIRNFSNTAHIYFLNQAAKKNTKIFGSIPHAVIQQFNGDIIKTFKQYYKIYKKNITMLVDYDNNILQTLNSLKPYLNKIHSIRVDTSNDLIDESLKICNCNKEELYGANMHLFFKIRKWLDQNNFNNIKIVCSSNNTLQKIKMFKQHNVPVDYYGIGSALNKLSLHFTADVVMNDDQLVAKVGRKYINTNKMKKYQ